MAYLLTAGGALPRSEGTSRVSYLVTRAVALVPLLARSLLEVGALAYGLFFVYQLFAKAWPLPNGDVKLYHQYAVAFWETQPRLTRLPMEYPPLSVLPFGLTLLPDLPGQHNVVFAYWVGAFVVLGFLAFRRFAPWGAWAYVAYLFVGALGTLLARYDLIPALVTLAALWAVERRRFVTAYVLVAASILLKLYPAFLVPAVVIAQWQATRARAHPATDGAPSASAASAPPVTAAAGHSPASRDLGHGEGSLAAPTRPWRKAAIEHIAAGLAICCALVALVFYGALRASPQAAFSALGYASARPLQVESLPATVLWLGTFLGIPAHAVFSFQSYNYAGPLAGVVTPLSTVAMILGCLWIYWRQAGGRLDAGQAMLAVLCVLLVTDKVFSPQYLIWVIPFVAAVEGFSALWLAICVMTTLDYPILYSAFFATMPPYDTRLMAVLALRNGLLVYATLRAILRPTGTHSRTGYLAWAWRLALRGTQAKVGAGGDPIAVRGHPAVSNAHEPLVRTVGHTPRLGEGDAARLARERGEHQNQKGMIGGHDT